MEFPYTNLLQQLAWDRYLCNVEENQIITRFYDDFRPLLERIEDRGKQLDTDAENRRAQNPGAPAESKEVMEGRVNEALDDIFRNFVLNDGKPGPENVHSGPYAYINMTYNAFHLRYFRLVAQMTGDRSGWLFRYHLMRLHCRVRGEELNTETTHSMIRTSFVTGVLEYEPKEEMERKVNGIIDPLFRQMLLEEVDRLKSLKEKRKKEQEEQRMRDRH